MRKYIKWTKELLEPIVASSMSYAECLRKMGKLPGGGNFVLLQRNIDKFELDTSHMTHQVWNKGKEFVSLDELKTPTSVKKRIITERGHCCERCGLHTWQDKQIPLELEHIDADNRNNNRENLLLLCPNCHALTPTWKRGKRFIK